MKVYKTVNNNIVRSYDNSGKEIIVTGKGIGFNTKAGDVIDEAKIEKIYSLNSAQASDKLVELLEKIPPEHIRITNLIIEYARQSLNKELSDSIYISLTDHISFAINRIKSGMTIHNGLLWEIEKYYRNEFQVAKDVLRIIKNETGIDMPIDEAGFIAMHFVEATMEYNESISNRMKTIGDVLKIIKYHFQIDINENSLAYERFIVHLKFFMERVAKNEEANDTSPLYEVLKKEYPNEFNCSEKIKEYFEKEKGIEITNSELVYLAIHIHRMVEK